MTCQVNPGRAASCWKTGFVTESDRDRDGEGRARQARPRDALGRPLPYGAEGVEPVSEEALPPGEALGTARELVKAGRAFSAHEVLEARWKAGPMEERDLWQGLAQLCCHDTRGPRESGGSRPTLRTRRGPVDSVCCHRTGAYGLDLDAAVKQARRHVTAALTWDMLRLSPCPRSIGGPERIPGRNSVGRVGPPLMKRSQLRWWPGDNRDSGPTADGASAGTDHAKFSCAGRLSSSRPHVQPIGPRSTGVAPRGAM